MPRAIAAKKQKHHVTTLRTVDELVWAKKQKKIFDVALGGSLDDADDLVEELLQTGFPTQVRDLDLGDIGSSTLPFHGNRGEHEPVVVNNVTRLMPLLKKCQDLRCLKLGNNWFGTPPLKHLAAVLKKNTALTKLDIAFNNIGDEGMGLIATALKKSDCNLRYLDLSHNSVGDKGMQELAAVIEKGAAFNLVRLALRHNNIGSSGIRSLKAALENPDACPYLRSLKLGNNKIGDAGAAELAALLQEGLCPRLSVLDLANNNITASGSHKLDQAVKGSDMRAELDIDLCANTVSAGTITSIDASLESGMLGHVNLSLRTQFLRTDKPSATFVYHPRKFRVEVNGLPVQVAASDQAGRRGEILFKKWEDGSTNFGAKTVDADVVAVLGHLQVKPARMFKAYRLAQLHRALASYPDLGEAYHRTTLQKEQNELNRMPRCYHLPEVGLPGQQAKELKPVARVYGTVNGQPAIAWDKVLGQEEEEDP
jgi:Ran GTPase-activating protein (RanGAP) involved in mRNA processing and transport